MKRRARIGNEELEDFENISASAARIILLADVIAAGVSSGLDDDEETLAQLCAIVDEAADMRERNVKRLGARRAGARLDRQ